MWVAIFGGTRLLIFKHPELISSENSTLIYMVSSRKTTRRWSKYWVNINNFQCLYKFCLSLATWISHACVGN